MVHSPQLSANLARSLTQLARALLAAARSWSLYPPEHPAIGASVSRLADAIREAAPGGLLAIGITPEPARRDDLWRSIVTALAGAAHPAFSEQAQQRLLAIAASAPDIGDLAGAVMAPKRSLDGSPMITSQAAAVLAAFRHLNGIVRV